MIFKRIVKFLGFESNRKLLGKKFTNIYEHNLFNGQESVSGPGSDLLQTEVLRNELPVVFKQYGITSVVDAPCGDFYWMQRVNLDAVKYIGCDIVEALIEKNNSLYASDLRSFRRADIVNELLPKADVIFCRDCLVHLTYEQAILAISNFKKSGSTYMLTTTFPGRTNRDLGDILWRPLDLTRPPFNLPPPVHIILEKCTENNGRYADKSMGLWRLKDVIL